MPQSNSNEQNVELNHTSIYYGLLLIFYYFIFQLYFQLKEKGE